MAGRVAYFTAGDRGAGHLTRGLAIGRALARVGHVGEYQIFAPETPYPALRATQYTRIAAPRDALIDPRRALETPLAAALRAFRPDLVVVDLFWAPLLHILPGLGCEAWLLLRDCPAAWTVGRGSARFDPRQYTRIVAIEPVDHAVVTHRVDPVVILNPDECVAPGALRRRIGTPEGRKLVAISHAGLVGELDAMRDVAPEGDVVTLDLHAQDAVFPACAWLADADAVVCGAGFNSYWEAHWLGYAARTRFVAFDRTFHNEHNRLARPAGPAMRENGADRLARWIAG